jgi:superfamily II DNA or RNA helicase
LEIIVDNEITIKGAPTGLTKVIIAELTIPNPQWQNNQRLGISNYKTERENKYYKLNDDDLIVPFGFLNKLWILHPIKSDYMINISEPVKRDYASLIKLYDYQEEAIKEVLRAKNGILVMPAGSGKTQTALEIIARLGFKALWITHTLDLLNQSKARAKDNMPGASLGVISEGRIQIGKHITFATVQTLSNTDLTQYKSEWDVIIVDESHRICGTAKNAKMFYKVLSHLSARYKIGLTATPYRNVKGTEKAMFSLLGEVITEVSKDVVRTIKAIIQPIQTSFTIEEDCLKTDGTIDYTKLVGVMADDEARNDLIAKHIKENKGHYCLVLSDRLSNLKALQERLGQGVIIDGKTKKDVREQRIAQVKAGLVHILYATYALAKEGLDIPRLDRLFLAMPRKDKATIIQAVGRIEREMEGKEVPVVYDFVDAADFYENQYTVRRRIYKKNGNEVI